MSPGADGDPPAPSDLVGRFCAGDEDAVREVYERYAGAVSTVARSVVGSGALADEVVQETFVKAWRAASTFDANRDLAPWLYTIARRTAIDTLRRERRPTTGGHVPEVEVAIEAPAFETTFQQFEVRRALDDLPDGEREVVRLSHLVGLSHPEIAERLGVPVGTVKSRSARAHRRLAAVLAHLGPARSDNS
ncbi:MAG: RNA polymerase sigma factor [Actinomycetota bacterium]